MHAAEVIAPPPLIYLAGLGTGYLLNRWMPPAQISSVVQWSVGPVVLALGVVLLGSFVLTLRAHSTAIDPYRSTTALVTDGPYRFTRNPGYLAMSAIYVGITVLADIPWALLTLIPVMVLVDRGVIAREERYLSELFGQTYTDYKSRVRRWLCQVGPVSPTER